MKLQKILVVFILFIIPFYTFSQNRKKWPPLTKAGLIGFLANPDCRVGVSNKEKGLVYSFFVHQDLFENNEKIKEASSKVFFLTYRYALRENVRLYDTLFMNTFTLDGVHSKGNKCFLGQQNPRNLNQTVLQKFSEVGHVLFFPCITMDGQYGEDKALIYKLDNVNCSSTKSSVDLDRYAISLALITKDYVINGTNKYKGVYISFSQANNVELARYYRFDDKSVFEDLYDRVKFKWEKE